MHFWKFQKKVFMIPVKCPCYIRHFCFFFPFKISCLSNAMMSGQTNFGNTNISLFLFTTIDPFLPCWEFHIVNDHLINPIPDSVWHKMLFLSAEDLPIHEFKLRGSKRYPEPPE